MSMWEIEALIEEGIRAVISSDFTDSEKRNLIWNLYRTQEEWDCSFTQFRLMEELLGVQYTATTSLEGHPEYPDDPAFFDALKNKAKFTFVYKNRNDKVSESNPVAAYWDPDSNLFYYDFGSPYWSAVESEEPKKIGIVALSDQVIFLAEAAGDLESIYHWIAFLINFHEEDAQKEKSRLAEIQTRFKQHDFSDHEPMHRSLSLDIEDWSNDLLYWFLEVER